MFISKLHNKIFYTENKRTAAAKFKYNVLQNNNNKVQLSSECLMILCHLFDKFV